MIENKPGAGGRISSQYVAQATPDGYTVLVGATGQMSIAAAIYHNLTYHPTKSFIPLNMIASFPLVLVVPADCPIKNVKELVAYAKAHPDKSNYGDFVAALHHRRRTAQAEDRHAGGRDPVSRAATSSNLCVVSGQCLFTISDGPPAIPLVKGGKTRALGGHRFRTLAGTSRRAEHGRSRLSRKSTRICGAASSCRPGTPEPIVTKLRAELGKALADPGVQDGLKKMAVTPGGPTGDAFKKRIDADIKTFSDVVTAAKLTFGQ